MKDKIFVIIRNGAKTGKKCNQVFVDGCAYEAILAIMVNTSKTNVARKIMPLKYNFTAFTPMGCIISYEMVNIIYRQKYILFLIFTPLIILLYLYR
ncbi:MAG: hypothetical protein AB7S40_08240 [Bacteroidales bacterium]|jgi:hypothetical protein